MQCVLQKEEHLAAVWQETYRNVEVAQRGKETQKKKEEKPQRRKFGKERGRRGKTTYFHCILAVVIYKTLFHCFCKSFCC